MPPIPSVAPDHIILLRLPLLLLGSLYLLFEPDPSLALASPLPSYSSYQCDWVQYKANNEGDE